MFESSRFKSKFGILFDYITDKETRKKLLNDDNFLNFYDANIDNISNLISNLNLIYSKEKVSKIVRELVLNHDVYKIEKINENIKLFVSWSNHYHSDVEPIRDADLDIISKAFTMNIEELVLDFCFKYDYKEQIKVKGLDISEIFYQSHNVSVKRNLYLILKRGNLDLFAAMYEKLDFKQLPSRDMSLILEEEIDDVLYGEELQKQMGDLYSEFLLFFFRDFRKIDRDISIEIIKKKNYSLLRDLIKIIGIEYKDNKRANATGISIYINKDDCDKHIVLLRKGYELKKFLSLLMNMSFSNGKHLKIDYLDKIKSIIDQEEYDKCFKDYEAIINISRKINREFNGLSADDKISLYDYIMALSDEKREVISSLIEEINLKLERLYKRHFVGAINSADKIVMKAEKQVIKDSNDIDHIIPIYTLKDEEPFRFLITAMHHDARSKTPNMYNRPTHKVTIDDPSKFCEDLAGGSDIISTSMLDNSYVDTFVGPYADVMYIFSDLDSDDLLGISPKDAGLDKQATGISLFGDYPPMSVQDFMLETQRYRSYNEIAIKRKNKDNKKILPTAILCFDEINDVSIKHAEYFEIPIIVINTKTYSKLRYFTPNKATRSHNY